MEKQEEKKQLDKHVVILYLILVPLLGWSSYVTFVRPIIRPTKTQTQMIRAEKGSNIYVEQNQAVENTKENWKFFVQPSYLISQNSKQNDARIEIGIRGEYGLSDLFSWLKPKKEIKETQQAGNLTNG